MVFGISQHKKSLSIEMYKQKSVLCLITARGGSKGIPKKNIIDLGGKPLIEWTIDCALKSKFIDRVVLSSDDEEIIKVALSSGCDVPFVRPKELAQDQSGSAEVIIHALTNLPHYDYFVLLQPTSPFRSVLHLDEMIAIIIENNYRQIVSVGKLKKETHFLYFTDTEKSLIPVSGEYVINKRRQDQVPIYQHNGSVYISEKNFFIEKKSFNCIETKMYEMDGYYNLDIDDKIDLDFANFLIEKQVVKP